MSGVGGGQSPSPRGQDKMEEEGEEGDDDEDNEDNGRFGGVMGEWMRMGKEGEEGDGDEDDEDNGGMGSVKSDGVRKGELEAVGRRGGEEEEVGRRRVGSGKIECAIKPYYAPFCAGPTPISSIGFDISHLTSGACGGGGGVRRGELGEVRRGGEEEEVGRRRVGSSKIECAI